jgi:hypothetical protein
MQTGYQEPQEKLFMKKPDVENLMTLSLYKISIAIV